MQSLQLVTSEPFNNVQCDFYQDTKQDIVMTREQIGQALGYGNPMIAIAKIHERHTDRLDKFSVLTKLGTRRLRIKTASPLCGRRNITIIPGSAGPFTVRPNRK